MVGSSSRLNGDDRFYRPPHARHQRGFQQKQQHQQKEPASSVSASSPTKPQNPPAPSPPPPLQTKVSATKLPETTTAASGCNSNLQSFIASTAPYVTPQYLSPTSLKKNGEQDGADVEAEATLPPSYILGDLWDSFMEWSAYGAEVPIVLNGTDEVLQYYVPFLSAIQLFVDKTRLVSSIRSPGEAKDVEGFQDASSSDGSNEGEREQLNEDRRELLRGNDCTDERDLSNGESDSTNRAQKPVFEFFEYDPPYGRQPFTDKISLLVSKFPDLKSYRSSDLLPSSWISVAWYPIYRIPTGPTLQDLDACFLSFHALSTLKNGVESVHPDSNGFVDVIRCRPGVSGKLMLPLPLIGLASYKFKGSIWTSSGSEEQQLATSLSQEAERWLSQRQVDHPDYRFFVTHYMASC